MSRARVLALFLTVAVISAAAGAAFHLWSRGAVGPGADARAAVERLYAAKLTELQGASRRVQDWRGRVLVVNFWATWCAPCREEIPVFVKLQARHGARGLQIIGIAIDEPAKVAEFAREFGINYPLLTGGPEALELLRGTGNRAGVLPYTLIIDRKDNLVSREPGGVKEDRLEALIQPLF